MEKVKAKLSCTSAQKGPYGTQINFWALYSTNPEDNSFAQATPSAQLAMMVNNPEAENFFEPGKSYFLDFTKAE